LEGLQLLLQVHDSLLGQVRLDQLDDALITCLRECMAVTVPYDDALVIPSEIKWSPHHWGDMHAWRGAVNAVAEVAA
jgi:hypothetical protein